MATANLFGILKDVLLLTEQVKRLNAGSEKLADKMEDHEKRLVRLETIVDIARAYPQSPARIEPGADDR